jgi:hypothetical protein
MKTVKSTEDSYKKKYKGTEAFNVIKYVIQLRDTPVTFYIKLQMLHKTRPIILRAINFLNITEEDIKADKSFYYFDNDFDTADIDLIDFLARYEILYEYKYFIKDPYDILLQSYNTPDILIYYV